MAESGGRGQSDSDTESFKFVIVGGGIAGVTCAETVSKVLEDFEVEEKHISLFEATCPNVEVIQTSVTRLDADKKRLKTESGRTVTYEFICICTGGKPKIIAENNPLVLGIRDTETVEVFQKKIKTARRIVIIGNGGIATELAYEIEGCEVIWAVKDESISHTFVDAGAAQFFLPQLTAEKQTSEGPSKRLKYTVQEEPYSNEASSRNIQGNALGPDWSTGIHLKGSLSDSHKIHIEYTVGLRAILTPNNVKELNCKIEPFPGSQEVQGCWPVYVELSNSKVYGCDFVVSATGVIPNTNPFDHNDISSDGGICVNDRMQANLPNVFAAGDVCSACWNLADHWIQMRLWSQARQMGAYAAKCMVAESESQLIEMDFCFELFAHVTKFFNYKVVLLGKFNAQDLENNHELLVRVTKGVEYVKLVLSEGRIHGAVLIGETDLEETIENLILNKLDVTPYKEHLLDPNIDIEDFFD